MIESLQLRPLSIVLILLVFLYTIQLVRTNRLSAHLAISWICTELLFLALCFSDVLLNFFRTVIGENNVVIAPSLFGVTWLAFLTLDSLTRISSLTLKIKEVNQELALTKERLELLEQKMVDTK